MIIKEVYERFCVPVTLQEHMIRVAWVAKIICNHWIWEKIDGELIIKSALLHDLWNIVKMDFSLHDEWYWESIERWNVKKQEIIQRYWPSAHDATLAMCDELWVDQRVIEIINCIGIESFGETQDVSNEIKIVRHADMSVDPWWITSIWNRFLEAQKRYPTRPRAQDILFEQLFEMAHQCQKELFSQTTIQPDDITNVSTKEIQGALRNFTI